MSQDGVKREYPFGPEKAFMRDEIIKEAEELRGELIWFARAYDDERDSYRSDKCRKQAKLIRQLIALVARDDETKKIAVDFYRWWHDQPGSNTEQGFDEWYAMLKANKEEK